MSLNITRITCSQELYDCLFEDMQMRENSGKTCAQTIS